jgi:hypothetical protein
MSGTDVVLKPGAYTGEGWIRFLGIGNSCETRFAFMSSNDGDAVNGHSLDESLKDAKDDFYAHHYDAEKSSDGTPKNKDMMDDEIVS